ncbi:MAG: DNA-directed RNA polymerase subunit alpha [Chloroflexota bacterium]|nr:DNA-directed RNA polymerase subunit alpha [Chloroflexota bacterium]
MDNVITEAVSQTNIQRTDEGEDPSYGAFRAEPLPRGYGHTLGNALRRVLLSSLPGAAVTAVRIEGVQHEFSTIPNVKEDVVQVVLNLKRIRLRAAAEESTKAYLDVPGPGVVRASDIRWPEQVEVVNPDQVVATLDNDQAHLSMELTIDRGTGYLPADTREDVPIGEIPVDAIYSPVRRVQYSVGGARVGQDTSLDQLDLQLWTDGTLTPEEALARSARLLAEEFIRFEQSVLPVEEPAPEQLPAPAPAPAPEPVAVVVPPELSELSVDDLGLTNRTLNCLKRNSISQVGQIADMTEAELLKLRNFGERSLQELRESLTARGVMWGSVAQPAPEADDEADAAAAVATAEPEVAAP